MRGLWQKSGMLTRRLEGNRKEQTYALQSVEVKVPLRVGTW